ncbi:hypothetical protein ABS71_04065 [bacterium SCN 62-11]|nr:hypothetical protein [Candidatus Eremiobacteraeota bacterium]ODT75775.1 MAG: hypothetical protein ABS71_04065 [bacterium SCN 62-11]
MDIEHFFERKVYQIDFECGRCRIYDEPKVTSGPGWLLELQIRLQSDGRRRNLVRILEAAGTLHYLPVTLEDVAQSFEAEVISGAGPWAELRPLLAEAAAQALNLAEVSPRLDLAALSAQQLEAVDQGFSQFPGYVKRVVQGWRQTRARVDLRELERAVEQAVQ